MKKVKMAQLIKIEIVFFKNYGLKIMGRENERKWTQKK